ncbi:MAG: hypothetical protein Q8P11_02025 [bacterium]|nr:hypothetical protein [bacterium]
MKELTDPTSPQWDPPENMVYDSTDISNVLSYSFKRTTSKFQLYSLDEDKLISPLRYPVGQPIIVLIHGNNQEKQIKTLFRWHRLVQYLQQHPEMHKKIRHLPMVLYQYDSSYSVQFIASMLRTRLDEHYRYSPVFFVGHSMGALVADAAAHENYLYDPYHHVGNIAIAGPLQGSPLAIPPLMRITFSYQIARDFLTAYYLLTMANWGAYSRLSEMPIKELLLHFGDVWLSDGMRSLFYNGRNVPIPSGSYYLNGKFFPVILDTATRCGIPGGNVPFFIEPILHHTEDVFRRKQSRFNYADSLTIWKRAMGVVPDTITHAGYLTKEKQNMDELKTLIQGGASLLNDYLEKKDDPQYEKQALQFLWTQFMFIPTGHKNNLETDYCANDGMVSGDSALNLSPGPNICVVNNGEISIDMDVVKSRCNDSIECVVHKNMNHADMVETQDPDYWSSVVESLATLVRRYFKYYMPPITNPNGGYVKTDSRIENILLTDEKNKIKDFFVKKLSTKADRLVIMRYNNGWQIRVDQYPQLPLLYYLKKENGVWYPSNAKELAFIP